MVHQGQETEAAGAIPRRLFFYNAGFLRQPRLRRILELSGHALRLGLPGPGDGVVVWGRSPYARRGEAVAARARRAPGAARGCLPALDPARDAGRAAAWPADDRSRWACISTASAVADRDICSPAIPLDDSNLLQRARDGISRISTLDLSKYNIHRPDAALPAPGYVLVIDQTCGDASIRHAGASAARFREMLAVAQEEHPGARIVIKSHPETALGLRPGHFGREDAQGRISLLTAAVSPWRLLEGAIAVYAVASQLGFEAILAGHRPRLFGQPFYAGWGLSADENPVDPAAAAS